MFQAIRYYVRATKFHIGQAARYFRLVWQGHGPRMFLPKTIHMLCTMHREDKRLREGYYE